MLHLQAAEFMAQSDDKKWQLVLQQDAASSKDPPAHYLDQLLVHIEAIEKQTKKGAKTKKLPKGTDPAGGLLRGLEISLRTNSLQWVKDFIGYQPVGEEPRKHGGLDILIDYFKKMDEEGRVDNHEHLCVLCLRALMNNAVSVARCGVMYAYSSPPKASLWLDSAVLKFAFMFPKVDLSARPPIPSFCMWCTAWVH